MRKFAMKRAKLFRKNLGSVISKAAKERIERYISEAESRSVKVLVDGRNYKVEGKEENFYVGPTVIDYVTTDMAISKKKFSVRYWQSSEQKDLDEAIAIENGSNYGNAASVFTQSGGMARQVMEKSKCWYDRNQYRCTCSREPFSFADGMKVNSRQRHHRKSSIEFWTKLKNFREMESGSKTNWMS